MAALGKLAGGVAHEINNPLTAILTIAQLMEEDLKENGASALPQFEEDITQIIMESKRIKDTILNFLNFNKTRKYEFKKYNLENIIESALNIMGRGMLSSYDIEKDFQADIGEVILSQFHITEALINILKNAVDSMPEGGKLSISTSKDGDYACVSIRDSGSGIPSDELDNIFEAYYTTKGKKGTGLGLPVVLDVIEEHKGRVEVSSELNGGTEFRTLLPLG